MSPLRDSPAPVISVREHDKILVRDRRDPSNKTVSREDAERLGSVLVGETQVFKQKQGCLVAQQYVGVVGLPGLTVEVMPKISGEMPYERLREVLMRMIVVSGQSGSVRLPRTGVSLSRTSFAEMLFATYLSAVWEYVDDGVLRSYRRKDGNLNKVKGKLLFGRQVTRNALRPERFWCRRTVFTRDSDVNRLLKRALLVVDGATRDLRNAADARDALDAFASVTSVTTEAALGTDVTFNVVTERARDAYELGRLVIEGMGSTIASGGTRVTTLLYDMNNLYERFIARAFKAIYGQKVDIQKSVDHLVTDDEGRKYVRPKPDLILDKGIWGKWVLDTKWKVPKSFIESTDVYQVNAYSSTVPDARRVFILYPKTERSERLAAGSYHIRRSDDQTFPLDVRTTDLGLCLQWQTFLRSIRETFGDPS